MKKLGKINADLRKPKQASKINFEVIDDIINFVFAVIAPVVLLTYWIQFSANPILIYHKQAPPFFTDYPFVKEFLIRPDGLSQFFSAFMFQFYEYGIIGTIVEVLLVAAVCIVGWFSLKEFSGSKTNSLIFLIAAFAVFFHVDYNGDPFHAIVNALFGFIGFLLFAKIYVKNQQLSFLIFTVLCGILTWFFTLACFLLFLLCGLFVMYAGKKRHLFILAPIYILITYFLIFHSGYGSECFDVQTSDFGKIAEIAIILTAPLIIRIRQIFKKAAEKGFLEKLKFISKAIQNPILCAIISMTVCLKVYFFADHYFFENKKYLIQIDYLACNCRWDETVETFGKLKAFNNVALVQLRRALLHNGKLLDEFFSYPQLKEKYFFPDYNNDVTVCMPLAEFFYELGHINFAEHLAHESLEFDGAKPRQLLLLSKINLLKGKTNAAKIFLYRLSKNPFHRKTALRLISEIENNEPFKEDEIFKSAREFVNTVPYAGYEVRDETFFNQLLVSNPKNRKAFECLIATLLANKNLAEAMRLIKAFEGFEFKTLPRHYEEAVLVWQVFEKHPEFAPGKYKLNTATLQRFNDFVRTIERHNGSLQNAKNELAENFGTTFWFYYFYDSVFNPSLKFYRQK